MKQSIREIATDCTRPQIPAPVNFALVETLGGMSFVMPNDTNDWTGVPCCFCISDKPKRCMWGCCGVTSCQECAYLFYTKIQNFLVCPWCGVAFPEPWRMNYFLITPTAAVIHEANKATLLEAWKTHWQQIANELPVDMQSFSSTMTTYRPTRLIDDTKKK